MSNPSAVSTSRIVHGTFDTFARVEISARRPGLFDVHVPFRVQLDLTQSSRVISYDVRVTVDGRPWSARTQTRAITSDYVAWLRARQCRDGMFDFHRLPPYIEMEKWLGRADVRFFEALIPAVPAGARVEYSFEATLDGAAAGLSLTSATYGSYAVLPEFTRDDLRRIWIARPGDALRAWVLYHRRSEPFDLYRLDAVELHADPARPGTDPDRVDLTLTVAGRTTDLGSAQETQLPWVDCGADSVTLAVAVGDAGTPPPITVCYAGGDAVTVDPSVAEPVGSARVMFVNFAIQGLNDYFGIADTGYDPPASYIEVTMRDPAATFSSRPDRKENGIGDGYAYTLEAHRRYGIPQIWVMNGGLIAMLAHDCPQDLAQIAADVRSGVLVPGLTGFPSHRMPYYRRSTNTSALALGDEVIANLVGRASPVYYPDSRIYVNADAMNGALAAAGIRYLVVDGGREDAGLGAPLPQVTDPEPGLFATAPDGRWLNWGYQWQDRTTGLRVLFIDQQLKDVLLTAPDPQPDQGKVPLDIRRKFLEIAAQPVVRRGNVLIYSDDADKASGNGWFDGDGTPTNIRYQAALSWIRAHPWVRAVTTVDLDAEDPVGTLNLLRASDPSILTPDGQALGPQGRLPFDYWYDEWARTPVAWLGETLGALSARAEWTIENWPVRNELYDLGRLSFAMCLHESQWSKAARTGNRDGTPEDFVVAETLQARNAHVYLNAAVWADWATAQALRTQAFLDAGPVIDRVAAAEAAAETGQYAAPWRNPARIPPGLQWDHDPLANVILYNTEALVVIDRNGGRITHLFTLVDGRAVSVSGTFKAYQFLDLDWESTAGVECDGIVLQNTVYGPNHAYVACDVEPSLGELGESPDDDSLMQWYYPDNFNAYVVADRATSPDPAVTLVYGASVGGVEAPVTLKGLQDLLSRDFVERVGGVGGAGAAPGVVLHDLDRFGAFEKTITLTGRTVQVRYRNTRAGHLVANEFCVDLWAAAMQGQRQTRTVAGAGAAVVNDGGLAVRVTLGDGCTFSDATMLPLDPPSVDSRRLHRVMTDTVEIVCPSGGDFDYRIDLPGTAGR